MVADVMPAAETDISEELVVALLREQHPDLAGLRVRFENNGWDSAIYRLGDDLAVRLPRRAMNAALLPAELRWLPTLQPTLPLPISAAVRVGEPGCGYPWPWSITPWFPGASWADTEVRDRSEAAVALGSFVRSLAVNAPGEAPSNPYRGGPLTERDAAVRDRVAQLGAAVDTASVLAVWNEALDATPNTERRWLHGDLHPANIVVRDGVIAAVIDWVDLSAGDIAYDLAAAWLCFPDPQPRAAFVQATCFTDEALWMRARGCALSHATACLANSADNPRMETVGRRSLDAVLGDQP